MLVNDFEVSCLWFALSVHLKYGGHRMVLCVNILLVKVDILCELGNMIRFLLKGMRIF